MQDGLAPLDLIKVASDLAKSHNGKPRRAHLQRAVSTIYYALFHTLAKCCADTLVGGPGASRSLPAWRQVYRALNHGQAKSACAAAQKIAGFPSEILDFANLFITMQESRHEADYNPHYRAYKSDVVLSITQAKDAIERFEAAPIKHRRAFAVLALLGPPKR